MGIIQAKILWKNGELVGACNFDANVNCEKFNLSSLQKAWITRTGTCCGGTNTGITFVNPNDASALSGVWVESDGQGMVLDAASVDAVVDACNACCGEDTTVPPQYGGVIPPMPVTGASKFCIKRADNGGVYAVNKAYMDYYGNYATMRHVQNLNGFSNYEITADKAPVPISGDTVTAGACALLSVTAATEGFTEGPAPTAKKSSSSPKVPGTQTEDEDGDVLTAVEEGGTDPNAGTGGAGNIAVDFCLKRKDDGSEKALKAVKNDYKDSGFEISLYKTVKDTSYYDLIGGGSKPTPKAGDTISDGPCNR